MTNSESEKPNTTPEPKTSDAELLALIAAVPHARPSQEEIAFYAEKLGIESADAALLMVLLSDTEIKLTDQATILVTAFFGRIAASPKAAQILLQNATLGPLFEKWQAEVGTPKPKTTPQPKPPALDLNILRRQNFNFGGFFSIPGRLAASKIESATPDDRLWLEHLFESIADDDGFVTGYRVSKAKAEGEFAVEIREQLDAINADKKLADLLLAFDAATMLFGTRVVLPRSAVEKLGVLVPIAKEALEEAKVICASLGDEKLAHALRGSDGYQAAARWLGCRNVSLKGEARKNLLQSQSHGQRALEFNPDTKFSNNIGKCPTLQKLHGEASDVHARLSAEYARRAEQSARDKARAKASAKPAPKSKSATA